MEVNKYSVELKDNKHPILIKEREHIFEGSNLGNPDLVLKMLNECFRLGYLAEEHIVLIAMNIKLKPLAIFEIGHGSTSTCIISNQAIFKRALLCGATKIIIAHNHPSGDLEPSDEDILAYNKLKDAGKVIGIKLEDFIIVSNEEMYSFAKQ
ncbi:JAB domain-containing protein [Peptoniphilaceae bacterium SGI.131]